MNVRVRKIGALLAGAACFLAWVQASVVLAQSVAPDRAVRDEAADAAKRAAATEAQMKVEERTVLTHGIMAVPVPVVNYDPKVRPFSVGYVRGIPRLGVPALAEIDAGLGVAWLLGKRDDDGATPLPASLATASSWNPALARRGGEIIGDEARSKGYNVLLAGGVNLIRDPRSGRNFEYYSEDPLLTGVMGGEAIAGVQSNHIISTVKHFAFNAQETARSFVDARITEAAARESDLLAFKIAIERGNPGAVMCAFNRVNGPYACDNDWLLNKVLKTDWRFPGFVMSDWDAVPGLSAAMHGLDQESGVLFTRRDIFGKPLQAAAAGDPRLAARVRDMNRRVLYAIYANGLDRYPATPKPINWKADLEVAEEVAREGSVLLRNEGNVLPLAATAKRIAVIGGYADSGVLSGGGSSQVQMAGGPGVSVPLGGDGPFASLAQQQYHKSVPLKAIKAHAPSAEVTFTRGDYIRDAVDAARGADVAIVFATEWRTEGADVPDLTLPNGQDALIAAVAAANPRTVVVLQTGGPVLMPWLDRTAAVLEAWYPGGRGGEAIASILFGETNPGGRLPVSFPRSVADLPRPQIDGKGVAPPKPFQMPQTPVAANYDIEGADVGYRWFARTGKPTLFPFGFGLSYTSFTRGDLKVSGRRATLNVSNTGNREGADVAQLYLVSVAGAKTIRLVGFKRVMLKAGERKLVTLDIDPRLLANWEDGAWNIKAGVYRFAAGADAEHLQAPVPIWLPARRWKD